MTDSPAPSLEELRKKLITVTHEWIRDAGLDIQDIEPFVDREVMPAIAEHHNRLSETNVSWAIAQPTEHEGYTRNTVLEALVPHDWDLGVLESKRLP